MHRAVIGGSSVFKGAFGRCVIPEIDLPGCPASSTMTHFARAKRLGSAFGDE
jgi:hypothetical protein